MTTNTTMTTTTMTATTMTTTMTTTTMTTTMTTTTAPTFAPTPTPAPTPELYVCGETPTNHPGVDAWGDNCAANGPAGWALCGDSHNLLYPDPNDPDANCTHVDNVPTVGCTM